MAFSSMEWIFRGYLTCRLAYNLSTKSVHVSSKRENEIQNCLGSIIQIYLFYYGHISRNNHWQSTYFTLIVSN